MKNYWLYWFCRYSWLYTYNHNVSSATPLVRFRLLIFSSRCMIRTLHSSTLCAFLRSSRHHHSCNGARRRGDPRAVLRHGCRYAGSQLSFWNPTSTTIGEVDVKGWCIDLSKSVKPRIVQRYFVILFLKSKMCFFVWQKSCNSKSLPYVSILLLDIINKSQPLSLS